MNIYGRRVIIHDTLHNICILEGYQIQYLGILFNVYSYYDIYRDNYILSFSWFAKNSANIIISNNMYISFYPYINFKLINCVEGNPLLVVSAYIFSNYREMILSKIRQSTISAFSDLISQYVV